MKFPIRRKVILLTVALSLALTAAAVFISYALFSARIRNDLSGACTDAAKSLSESVSFTNGEMLLGLQKDIDALVQENREAIEYWSSLPDPDQNEKNQFFENLTGDIFPPAGRIGMSYDKLVFLNEYRAMVGGLNTVMMSSDLQGAALVCYDPEHNELVFLADATSATSPRYNYPASVMTVPNEARRYFLPAGTGTAFFEGGYCLCTCMLTPEEEDPSVPPIYAVVQASLKNVSAYQSGFVRNMAGVMLGVTAVLALVYVLFVDRFVAKNVRRLSDAARSFTEQMQENAEGGLTPVRADIRSGDEVEDLSRGFDLMQDKMAEYIRTIGEKTAREESIRAELALASRIQAESLPKSGFEARGARIDSLIRPAKEVGGDLYDYFLVDEDHLFFAEADVSGKGVPAALFMMRGKELIKAHASAGKSPGEVAKAVNTELCKNNEEGLFITAFFGLLELSTGLLRYARAGHEQPFLIRGGEARQISEESNFVLGLFDYFDFEEDSLTLQRGDRLMIFTDGLDEGIDPQEEAFGYDRIREVLERTPGNTLPALYDALAAFANGAEQFDDVTLLQLTAGTEKSWELAPPSYDDITTVCDGLHELLADLPADPVSELCMVTDEVMNNCISYAYDGVPAPALHVALSRFAGLAQLEFADNGNPFDPLAQDTDAHMADDLLERPEGGMGIFLVKQFADAVRYEYRDGRNVLTIKKKLQ
nr:SpoIIE family protein phosphatase [Lachnospiraceae bacterium]